MNRLSPEKRTQVIAALVEGNSIRATVRMTGVAKNTVVKLLGDIGLVCSIYQDRMIRDMPCERVQCDEIWSFVYAKEKNVPRSRRAGEDGVGNVWTWVALDPDSKLVLTYRVGSRDVGEAIDFMEDVAKRLRHRVQLTTDGHHAYLQAVTHAFEDQVDYAQLIKTYGTDPEAERRYSPAVVTGIDIRRVSGEPELEHISTSYIERQNLTMRMSMRRFTRLTNGFSKRVENHAAAVSLHFAHYNLCRRHQSLDGQTPAMAAGLTDHVWPLSELVGLLEQAENVPTRRGSYKRSVSN